MSGEDRVLLNIVLNDTMSNRLTKREILVLELCYGINDGIRWKLPEIATDMGVTPARIRSIRDRALRKLNKLFRNEELYFDMFQGL